MPADLNQSAVMSTHRSRHQNHLPSLNNSYEEQNSLSQSIQAEDLTNFGVILNHDIKHGKKKPLPALKAPKHRNNSKQPRTNRGHLSHLGTLNENLIRSQAVSPAVSPVREQQNHTTIQKIKTNGSNNSQVRMPKGFRNVPLQDFKLDSNKSLENLYEELEAKIMLRSGTNANN